MAHTRAPRPTDLVALVTFDGEVRENQAVTREALTHRRDAPRPLSAAIEQWLHLGRRTWVHVAGREIRGIATARELNGRTAWEIDTLIDATAAAAGETCTVAELLRQACASARDAHVTHLVLRTAAEAPAIGSALHTGFRPVAEERWWCGRLAPAGGDGGAGVLVRDWREADLYPAFQLYNRSMPVEARSAFAMTLDEWEATRERRWQDRNGTLVAEHEGRVVGLVRLARASGQFALHVEPGAAAAADALVRAAADRLRGARGDAPHGGLIAAGAITEEAALQRAGLRPAAVYALLCLRIRRAVRDEQRARARVPIIGG